MSPSFYMQITFVLPGRPGNLRDAYVCVPEHVYLNSPPMRSAEEVAHRAVLGVVDDRTHILHRL